MQYWKQQWCVFVLFNKTPTFIHVLLLGRTCADVKFSLQNVLTIAAPPMHSLLHLFIADYLTEVKSPLQILCPTHVVLNAGEKTG